MQQLGHIDLSQSERSFPTIAEREQQHNAQKQQEKEDLYQQLSELCRLQEYEAAKQLARRYEGWGYAIVDGEVVENLENLES